MRTRALALTLALAGACTNPLPPPVTDASMTADAALAYLEEREKQYDVRARADLHAAEAPRRGDDDEPIVRRALLCAPRAPAARRAVRAVP